MAGLETTDAMFDLRMSEDAKPLFESVKTFVEKEVEPVTREFFELLALLPDVGSRVAWLDVIGVERRVHGNNLTHDQGQLMANIFAVLKSRLDRGRQ